MNNILVNQFIQFAQTSQSYNCGAYGQGGYNTNENCQTTADGSGLANTGEGVVVGIAGGVLLIVIAVVVLVVTRKKKSKK